jgi:signal transduction histidine kinase
MTHLAEFARAEETLRAGRIAIAILDMDATGSLGVEALPALRSAAAGTPLVALTGVPERYDESALYLAGALEILRRPLERSVEISAVLRRAIVRQASMPEQRHAPDDLALAIGRIVHDLVNPLTTIELCAAALIPQGMPPAGEHRMADLIHQSASLMHQMIRDLSDRADLELGRLQLERQLLDVHDLLVAVADRFALTTLPRHITFSTRCDDGLPAVLADRDRIVRCLSHIVRAAVAAARAGAHVELSVQGMHHDTKGTVRGRPEPAVRFSVRHTGPHNEMQTSGSEASGLPLARALIEAHGGSMDIAVVAGQETTFSFSLPALGDQTGAS